LICSGRARNAAESGGHPDAHRVRFTHRAVRIAPELIDDDGLGE
jgi:hypothetical protein